MWKKYSLFPFKLSDDDEDTISHCSYPGERKNDVNMIRENVQYM